MQATEHAEQPWPAPFAAGPVRASALLPGSKSITNRALVLAALASGPTTITGPLVARDTELMAGAIAALGATVERRSERDWLVTPGAATGPVLIDVGNAGTVLRFVPPAAALADGDVEFTGDPRASQRPVGPLLAALRQAGVEISDDGRAAVPFVLHGRGGAPGGSVTLDASSSSQLVSGLMLSAPRYDKGIEIRHHGPQVPSAPHIAMTAAMLTAAGAQVDSGQDIWLVHPGPLTPGTIAVEPDLSNAAPFLGAAIVTGGQVAVPGWPEVSLQAADQILAVLTAMGATWRITDAGLLIEGSGTITGITADLRDINELAPVLTAVAALADGPSEFTGIGHMRHHECDRLAVLTAEIGALGGDVTELPDGLSIRPRPLRATARPFDTHNDHRMVMAAAVLGLAVPGLSMSNAATVGKTFPGFLTQWTQLFGQAP